MSNALSPETLEQIKTAAIDFSLEYEAEEQPVIIEGYEKGAIAYAEQLQAKDEMLKTLSDAYKSTVELHKAEMKEAKEAYVWIADNYSLARPAVVNFDGSLTERIKDIVKAKDAVIKSLRKSDLTLMARIADLLIESRKRSNDLIEAMKEIDKTKKLLETYHLPVDKTISIAIDDASREVYKSRSQQTAFSCGASWRERKHIIQVEQLKSDYKGLHARYKMTVEELTKQISFLSEITKDIPGMRKQASMSFADYLLIEAVEPQDNAFRGFEYWWGEYQEFLKEKEG